MATFRKNGDIHTFFDKMVNGMIERGMMPNLRSVVLNKLKGLAHMDFQNRMPPVLHC